VVVDAEGAEDGSMIRKIDGERLGDELGSLVGSATFAARCLNNPMRAHSLIIFFIQIHQLFRNPSE
jgi:hypothetical protein